MEKTSVSGVFYCPLCRKPCSEGVCGATYICHSHQKKVCWFCEESRLLLCIECLVSPEHKFHCELAIEDAISHYKVRAGNYLPELFLSTLWPLCLVYHRASITDTFCFFCFILFGPLFCFSLYILLLVLKCQCITMSLRG